MERTERWDPPGASRRVFLLSPSAFRLYFLRLSSSGRFGEERQDAVGEIDRDNL